MMAPPALSRRGGIAPTVACPGTRPPRGFRGPVGLRRSLSCFGLTRSPSPRRPARKKDEPERGKPIFPPQPEGLPGFPWRLGAGGRGDGRKGSNRSGGRWPRRWRRRRCPMDGSNPLTAKTLLFERQGGLMAVFPPIGGFPGPLGKILLSTKPGDRSKPGPGAKSVETVLGLFLREWRPCRPHEWLWGEPRKLTRCGWALPMATRRSLVRRPFGTFVPGTRGVWG
ncbi:MAG: hypothetical protein CM15mP78_10410 [Candidatus Poseidoniales archaeon]|nr:MAG: hypothetical protein CM15mP78_10410 [Candidatus Poseidoniales archaeon]